MLVNKANYNQKVLSTFNVVSAYFADTFYNHIYLTALDRCRSSNINSSLTDEYKACIRDYSVHINDAERLKSVIIGLHEYYRTHTRYSTITLADFIDELLKNFVPEEHYNAMNLSEKNFFTTRIITNIAKNICKHVLQMDILRNIIDFHSHTVNTQKLVSAIIQIQIDQRESMYVDFVNSLDKGKNDKVDKKFVEKIVKDRNTLFDQLKEAIEKKIQFEQERDRAKKIVVELNKSNKNLESQITYLQSKIAHLEEELNKAKRERLTDGIKADKNEVKQRATADLKKIAEDVGISQNKSEKNNSNNHRSRDDDDDDNESVHSSTSDGDDGNDSDDESDGDESDGDENNIVHQPITSKQRHIDLRQQAEDNTDEVAEEVKPPPRRPRGRPRKNQNPFLQDVDG